MSRKQGLKAGFLSYLTKPVSVKEFMEGLDDVLKFTAAQLTSANEP